MRQGINIPNCSILLKYKSPANTELLSLIYFKLCHFWINTYCLLSGYASSSILLGLCRKASFNYCHIDNPYKPVFSMPWLSAFAGYELKTRTSKRNAKTIGIKKAWHKTKLFYIFYNGHEMQSRASGCTRSSHHRGGRGPMPNSCSLLIPFAYRGDKLAP